MARETGVARRYALDPSAALLDMARRKRRERSGSSFSGARGSDPARTGEEHRRREDLAASPACRAVGYRSGAVSSPASPQRERAGLVGNVVLVACVRSASDEHKSGSPPNPRTRNRELDASECNSAPRAWERTRRSPVQLAPPQGAGAAPFAAPTMGSGLPERGTVTAHLSKIKSSSPGRTRLAEAMTTGMDG
jgi:hypothetical protein